MASYTQIVIHTKKRTHIGDVAGGSHERCTVFLLMYILRGATGKYWVIWYQNWA